MSQRLDKLILQLKLVPSREIAQSLIMRGDVLVDDRPVTKSGALVSEDANIRIRGELPKFVSRGGDKLEGALIDFDIDVSDKIAIDLGASTGGFTDCLLQRGATKVYAIDVGTAQMAEKLRQDCRVVVMEKFHAKDLTPELFKPKAEFGAVDVSFIGLTKVLPYLVSVMSAKWEIVALVKPQFELGPEFVSAGGIVKSEKDQEQAVSSVCDFCKAQHWAVCGSAKSKLLGAKSGNQEYFVYLSSGVD